MKYIFACNNKSCIQKEGSVFRLEIPCEAIMDERNMAKIFCHKCGAGMIMEQRRAAAA